MLVDPLTKPIPKDTFKVHVISLGLRRLQFLGMINECIMNIFVVNFYEIKNWCFFIHVHNANYN